MCKICYDDPVLSRKPFEKWIREAYPVNYAKRHMDSHGYDEAGNKAVDNRGKRKHADMWQYGMGHNSSLGVLC